MDHGDRMDRIYRHQRHVYDATRVFFLAGRDRLIRAMDLRPGDRVLEVGCGTGRNLGKIARRYPGTELFGLDVSKQMLQTAGRKLKGLNVALACGSAEELDPVQLFGQPQTFDAIIFSYSLSMIPDWRKALETAMTHMNAGGSLHIVDFYDQGNWPKILRTILIRWLAQFGVRFDSTAMDFLQSITTQDWTVRIEPLFARYAFLARLTKSEK